MGKKRRSFSTEFKHEAACLVVDQGYSMTEACRSLYVGETGLPAGLTNLKLNGEASRP